LRPGGALGLKRWVVALSGRLAIRVGAPIVCGSDLRHRQPILLAKSTSRGSRGWYLQRHDIVLSRAGGLVHHGRRGTLIFHAG
jgi:hypothetical protein